MFLPDPDGFMIKICDCDDLPEASLEMKSPLLGYAAPARFCHSQSSRAHAQPLDVPSFTLEASNCCASRFLRFFENRLFIHIQLSKALKNQLRFHPDQGETAGIRGCAWALCIIHMQQMSPLSPFRDIQLLHMCIVHQELLLFCLHLIVLISSDKKPDRSSLIVKAFVSSSDRTDSKW